MILNKLIKTGVLTKGANIPRWLPDNTVYLTIMGSMAYGVSSDNSDMDIYGVAMPPKETIFPHLAGHIDGFGPRPQGFDVWQQHHLEHGNQSYDFQIYSIVKFFHLLAENNPNMIDSIYTPRRCILHTTSVGELIRENRSKFIHRGAISKFKGYAYQQMHKIRTKQNASNEKRAADIKEFGFDLKFAYHVVRLVQECEQLLLTGDLDLEKDREVLKAIRRGEWELERLEQWFKLAETRLDALKETSKLPEKPDYKVLRELLHNCLEAHYGNLDNVISKSVDASVILNELRMVLEKYE